MQRMRVRAAEMLPDRDGVLDRRPGGIVVPFLRPEAGAGRSAPVVGIDRDARPAPVRFERFLHTKAALFLFLSLALHAGVYAAFRREAPPLASVGVQSISVEIVLGGDRVAGVAEKPTDAESTVNAVASQGEAPDLVKPETARPELKVAEAVTPVEPLKETRQAVEAKPEQRQEVRETPAAAVATSAPEATTAPPQAAVAELQAPPLTEPKAAERPPEVQAVIVPPPPRKRPAVARRQKQDRGEDARTRESTNSTASAASSGIGRGRSDAVSNYRGIVQAQLRRNMHFPPDAKRNGQEGTAIVSFVIQPSGNVARVALVRGTGVASLDREAVALVRRAAPFPPPPSPDGFRPTVPINFHIR